ncbi:MAG: hypothetical protein DSM106950_46695 [Stigonema ocellatum SAG 48.90 = DSM 106950]|nr:hypothetical protein [Stigonema ocellatum SAG 48.90 = DSM 106950]
MKWICIINVITLNPVFCSNDTNTPLYHNQDLVKLHERNTFLRTIYEKIQAINSTDDLGEIKHIASTMYLAFNLLEKPVPRKVAHDLLAALLGIFDPRNGIHLNSPEAVQAIIYSWDSGRSEREKWRKL